MITNCATVDLFVLLDYVSCEECREFDYICAIIDELLGRSFSWRDLDFVIRNAFRANCADMLLHLIEHYGQGIVCAQTLIDGFGAKIGEWSVAEIRSIMLHFAMYEEIRIDVDRALCWTNGLIVPISQFVGPIEAQVITRIANQCDMQ